MTNTNTTINNNNILTLGADSSSSTFANFGVYQQTPLVQSHHSGFSTEQTIVTHSDPEAMVNNRPLVIKKRRL